MLERAQSPLRLAHGFARGVEPLLRLSAPRIRDRQNPVLVAARLLPFDDGHVEGGAGFVTFADHRVTSP